jgi:hypothetical protein
MGVLESADRLLSGSLGRVPAEQFPPEGQTASVISRTNRVGAVRAALETRAREFTDA